jgi:hypothetical protein
MTAINPDDLRIFTWNSRRKGAFSLRDSYGVHVIHLPTGIEAKVESEKSAYKNKVIAISQIEIEMTSLRFVAVIERHDRSEKRFVPVPVNQSLDFDPDTITREWLHPYLNSDWHLFEFLQIQQAEQLEDGK